MVINTKKLVDTQQGLLDRTIFTNRDIYQQELEQIFGRAWLFIGHDSLIPNPNDFFLTYMGEDPVILTRDSKGEVHAFLNMCMHRGNRVARADDGNAKNFMCTYHGWTYSSEGKLVSVPGLQEAYYGELDTDKLGLVSVGQIDSYAGLIFATWDPEAPSLEEYLGNYRWYLDTMFNRRDSGVELIGPTKWTARFNWKLASDNFGGDAYHIYISHRSAFIAQGQALGMKEHPGLNMTQPGGQAIHVGNGHGLGMQLFDNDEEIFYNFNNNVPPIQEYEKAILPEVERRLGSLRARRVLNIHGNIFPHASLLWPQVNGTIRLWQPRGPSETEIWSFTVLDKDAPGHIKQMTRLISLRNFGPSGLFEEDDMDNWRQVTESGQSLQALKTPSLYGMSIGHETKHDMLPGTSTVQYLTSEVAQRGFYDYWQQMMDAKNWGDISMDPITASFDGNATFSGH